MFKISKKFTLILVALLILVVLSFIPFKTALVFYKENTENLEAYLPVNEGDSFQLIWKHSIHLTDVVEKYKVLKNHDIKQYEIVYDEFGIGMPSNAQDGETFAYENGEYHIKDLDNIFPTIKVRNGKTVSENRIAWGGDAKYIVPFNQYFRPGDWFTLKVEDLSLWDYVKGVRIHE